MDLPTYTNIWRIEKRLYKLYDFRLPMPLPINWIAVFAGITIPYIVLLIAIGLPFNHTLVWLYVLPPGLLTWLTTRPVIENKRLPELVESQVRYLTEPRTWVRLTPLSEKDQMVLTARVWQDAASAGGPPGAGARPRAGAARGEAGAAQPLRPAPGPVLKPTSVFRPEPGQAVQGQPGRQRQAQARRRGRGHRSGPGARSVRAVRNESGSGTVKIRARAGHGAARAGAAAGPPGSAGRPRHSGDSRRRPERSGLPAHAMPDVFPPAAAFAPPTMPRRAQAPTRGSGPPAAPAEPPCARGRARRSPRPPRARAGPGRPSRRRAP